MEKDGVMLKEILTRLRKCEEDAASKDQGMKRLHMLVAELKDDLKVKETEINTLKSSNQQLTQLVQSWKQSNRNTEAVIDEAKVSVDASIIEDLKNFKVAREESPPASRKDLEDKISCCESAIVTLEKKLELLPQSGLLINRFNEVKTQVDAVEKKVDSHTEESVHHWKNIENILFRQPSLQRREVVVQWVMQDYTYRQRRGSDVYSPVLDTTVDRYRFQLFVKWTTKGWKKTIGLFVILHRDRAKQQDKKDALQPFKHEYTLSLMKKQGDCEIFRVDRQQMQENKSSFCVAKGSDKAAPYGVDMLAPPEDFIINNCLFASCIIHLR